MLPARNRMRRREDFAATVRNGRRCSVRRVVVHVAPCAAGGATSVGLVVPRSVGSAVERNQVKRRLRAQLADRLGNLDPGTCLVVRALPGSRGASSTDLRTDLNAALVCAERRAERRADPRRAPR